MLIDNSDLTIPAISGLKLKVMIIVKTTVCETFSFVFPIVYYFPSKHLLGLCTRGKFKFFHLARARCFEQKNRRVFFVCVLRLQK